MTNIALKTAARAEVVESIFQMTLPAGEAITAGSPVRIDPTTGTFYNATGTSLTDARVYGIATRTAVAGFGLTAIRQGVMDGFVLDGLPFDAPIYASNTDGALADTPGTEEVCVGRVIPGTSSEAGSYNKLLLVELGGSGAIDAGGNVFPQQLEITGTGLTATGSIFIANRPYQVTAVSYVHSTAGSDAGAVNVALTKDAGTAAPGAGAVLQTDNANAGFNAKGAINTVQNGTLTGTAANLKLAAGDRLSLLFTGTTTALAGVVVTVSIKPI